jgi:hypothetical protein
MKRFLNKMLFALFCHYRKKNDAFIASFHSKGIIGVTIALYFLVVCFFLEKVLGYQQFKLDLPSSKIIFGLIILLPCEILVYLLTDNYKILEEKYLQGECSYTREGWRHAIIFFSLAIAGVFILAFYNHLVPS